MISTKVSDNIVTREIKNPLTKENYKILGRLIKEGQPSSVLASLSQNLIEKYIEISIKSENLFFYTCERNNQIIGYALWARNNSFLVNEFKDIKYSILINLIINFRIKTIMNIILAISKIEFLFLSKNKRDFVNKNLIFSLTAFEKKFQSKGIGTVFCDKMFKDLNEKYKFPTIIVEPIDERAKYFFINKFNFIFLAKKIRFFKTLEILYKNFD